MPQLVARSGACLTRGTAAVRIRGSLRISAGFSCGLGDDYDGGASGRADRHGDAGDAGLPAAGGVRGQGADQVAGRVPEAVGRSGRRSAAVLGRAGQRRAALVQAVHQGAGVERAVRQVVRRRQDERVVQLPRSQSGGRAAATGRRSSGKASRATRGRSPTPSCTAKCASSPTCSRTSASRRATSCRSTCRWCRSWSIAMLACARIGAIHSVIFAGFSAEAIADRNNDAQAKLHDHGRRRLAPRQGAAAQGRRSTRRSPSRRRVEKCIVLDRVNEAVHMQPGRDFWWHELMADGVGRLPGRAARQRSAAVHPLHQRLDRQTQGHQAHHRRLQPVRQEDVRVGVRPPRRRRLLVHGRLRLGHRAQLRRLRPALGRRDGADVRRRAELSRRRAASGRSSRSTRSRSSTPRRPRSARSSSGATTTSTKHDLSSLRLLGHGRRRDQSRSLDVVPPQDRRRALPDRRHLVADRNGRHHDEPAARRDRHQAGQLHQAAAGHHSGDRRSSRASRSARIRAAGW